VEAETAVRLSREQVRIYIYIYIYICICIHIDRYIYIHISGGGRTGDGGGGGGRGSRYVIPEFPENKSKATVKCALAIVKTTVHCSNC